MTDLVLAEVFHPGEFIKNELEALGWKEDDLAQVTGRSKAALNKVINGKAAITPALARDLADAFGTSAELWMTLQQKYQLHHEEGNRRGSKVAAMARLRRMAPIREMQRRGWIRETNDPNEIQSELSAFCGRRVGDEDTELPHFGFAARSVLTNQTPEQKAWACRARQLAECIKAGKYNKDNWPSVVADLKPLLADPDAVRMVPRVMGTHGIRFLVIEHLKNTKIDGVALWLDETSPVIAVSLRFGRIDNFWHTVLHELVHIRRQDAQHVDTLFDGLERSQVEKDVDQAAAELVIPSNLLEDFILRVSPFYSKERIVGFCRLHKIHPGLLVGQLQHRGHLPYNQHRAYLVDVRESVIRASLTDGHGTAIAN